MKYKKGHNGYALYWSKNGWKVSASVCNEDVDRLNAEDSKTAFKATKENLEGLVIAANNINEDSEFLEV
ncbi:MAG: hypothetical protein ACI9ES_002293 [Oceanospirillaceae bacterium]|jgi:hypothetical protein